MHSQSRSWKNPDVVKREKIRKTNEHRRKTCPDSYAWVANLDYDIHKQEYTRDLNAQWKLKHDRYIQDQEERERLDLPPTPETQIKPALDGKKFGDNRSSVLGEQTVFCEEYHLGRGHKPIPDWPGKVELKYEGDERIATDKLHRRFLGAPRVPGNETVNWMQRSILKQYHLENFFYPIPDEEAIFFRWHYVQEREITDREGREAIGNELMDMLDE